VVVIVAEQEVADDYVILPEDIPVPAYLSSTGFAPPATWPTASGVTMQQANDACQRVVESSAIYSICREHVNTQPVITTCVQNI